MCRHHHANMQGYVNSAGAECDVDLLQLLDWLLVTFAHSTSEPVHSTNTNASIIDYYAAWLHAALGALWSGVPASQHSKQDEAALLLGQQGGFTAGLVQLLSSAQTYHDTRRPGQLPPPPPPGLELLPTLSAIVTAMGAALQQGHCPDPSALSVLLCIARYDVK